MPAGVEVGYVNDAVVEAYAALPLPNWIELDAAVVFIATEPSKFVGSAVVVGGKNEPVADRFVEVPLRNTSFLLALVKVNVVSPPDIRAGVPFVDV